MVTYSPSDDPPPVGTMSTYSCDTGYELSGASTRNCVAVSGWSETLPVCNRQLNYNTCSDCLRFPYTAVDCGNLTDPTNGAVDTSTGTTFMMTATYICNTGYLRVGSVSRTCGTSGTSGVWSGEAPVCNCKTS